MKTFSRFVLFIAKRLPRGYFRVLRFAAERDPALQDIFLPLNDIPISLRGDLRESVFTPIFRSGALPHQLGFDRLCRRMLRTGDVIYDIGANVGYTSALFSHIVGLSGRVFAVEPSPRSFALLSRSMGSVSNVTLLNFGVSNIVGELAFYVPPSLDLASLIPIEGADQLKVAVAKLDDLCATHGQPHFIKVDVEGHEPSVFEGGSTTLSRDDRPIIVFEALEPESLQHCIAILSERSGGGYQYRRITNCGMLIPLNASGSSDYIAIPVWAEERVENALRAGDAP